MLSTERNKSKKPTKKLSVKKKTKTKIEKPKTDEQDSEAYDASTEEFEQTMSKQNESNSLMSLFEDSNDDIDESDEDDESEVDDNSLKAIDDDVEYDYQDISKLGQDLPEDLDVFEHAYRAAITAGDLPKFRIYKNGEFLSVKVGQYSYDRLQKEFGGGHYKIYAFRNINGKYIKGQSKIVAEPMSKFKDEDDDNDSRVPQKENLSEIITALKSLVDDNKSKEVEAVRAQTESRTTEMSMIMQMMNQQFQMQVQMMQKQNNDNMKMMEMMMTNMQALGSKKQQELSPMELIKLIESSKTKGATEMKAMLEMAKELSETMYGGGGGDDDEPKEKESLAETLIKILPALVATGQQMKPQAQQSLPPQNQVQASQVSQVNQRPLNVVPPTLPVQSKPAPQPIEVEAEKPQAPKEPIKAELGRLSFVDDEAEEIEPSEESEEELEAELNEGEEYKELPDEGELVDDNEGEVIMANDVKDAIISLIQPDLIKAFIFKASPELTARNVVLKLKKAGWQSEQVLKAFPDEGSILDVASKKGLPDTVHGQLKELYGFMAKELKKSDGVSSRNLNG